MTDDAWITVREAARRLDMNEPALRVHIRQGTIWAKRAGTGKRAPWLVDADQVAREVELKAHRDRLRAHGVVVGRGEDFHAKVEAEHGADIAAEVRDIADRHALLEQAAAEVDRHRAELGLQFVDLDDEAAIEREARELVRRVRRQEAVRRRALQLLDMEDDDPQ